MKLTAIAIVLLSQIALVVSETYPARAEDVDACAALVSMIELDLQHNVIRTNIP